MEICTVKPVKPRVNVGKLLSQGGVGGWGGGGGGGGGGGAKGACTQHLAKKKKA